MDDLGLADLSVTTADKPDAIVDPGISLEVANFTRRFFSRVNASLGTHSAAKVALSTAPAAAWSAWDNIASHAAKQSFVSGTLIQPLPNLADIPAPIHTYAPGNTNHANWEAASGTYYYKAVFLYGPVDRLVGRVGGEVSYTATKDSGTCAHIAFGSNTGTNLTLRLYRGTTSGQYDRYVDIGVINDPDCYDLGHRIGTGERWKTRTAGPVDAVNSSLTYSRAELNGRNVLLQGEVLPTVGAFVAGDEVRGANFSARFDGSSWRLIDGTPHVAANFGDANYTVPELVPDAFVRTNTALTAERTVTLEGGRAGMRRQVVRGASSGGGYNLLVKEGATTVATLSGPNQSVILYHNGYDWIPNR